MRLGDTTEEAQRVVDQVYRSMPAWRKYELLGDLYRFGRELHAAGVLRRYPDASPAQIRRDWISALMPGLAPSRDFHGNNHLTTPSESFSTLEQVVDTLDRLQIPYALGGSLASSIHGINRNTADADLSVEPFHGKEVEFVESFGPDFDLSADAVRSALWKRTSFNIINTSTGFKVDFFVRKHRPFEVSMMNRRQPMTLSCSSGKTLNVVSPEDIILLKLEWYRHGNEISDRQWSDIANVLRVQSGRLDETYLTHWAKEIGVADLLARARSETS